MNKLTVDLVGIVSNIVDNSKKAESISSNLLELGDISNKTIVELGDSTGELNSKSYALDQEIDSVAEYSNGVKLQLTTVLDEIESQGAAINQSSSAIEQMDSSINSLSKNTKQKLHISASLEQSAKDGETNMKNTVKYISQVGQSTKVIEDFVQIIDDITARTNLLGMNAAIEAAHAGDSGKGFAVVAGEIRKLAENASKSTSDISNKVKDILSDIALSGKAAAETELIFKAILSGATSVSQSMQEIDQTMEELSSGSQEITIALGDLLNISSRVKDSSMEMEDRITAISSSIVTVHNYSGESRAQIEQFTNKLSGLQKVSSDVHTAGDSNSHVVKELEETVKKFNI